MGLLDLITELIDSGYPPAYKLNKKVNNIPKKMIVNGLNDSNDLNFVFLKDKINAVIDKSILASIKGINNQ